MSWSTSEPLTIAEAALIRRQFDALQMCSILLDDHLFVRVEFEGVIVAVLCSKCSRYPLEIMSHWEIVGDEIN